MTPQLRQVLIILIFQVAITTFILILSHELSNTLPASITANVAAFTLAQ